MRVWIVTQWLVADCTGFVVVWRSMKLCLSGPRKKLRFAILKALPKFDRHRIMPFQ